MEHEFQIRLLFATAAIFGAYEAMKAEGWQRYAFWTVTGLFAAIALGWQWLKDLYAPATAFIVSIATNNETWVLLFALIMLAVAVSSKPKSSPQILPNDEKTYIGKSIEESELSKFIGEQLEIQENKLRGEIAGTYNHINQVREQISDFGKHIEEMEHRTNFPPNMGETLGEALTSAENVRLSQLTRIEAAVDKSRKVNENVAFEILHLLDYAVLESTAALLANILRMAPQLPISREELTDDVIAQIETFIILVRSAFYGDNRNLDMNEIVRNAEAQVERSYKNMPAHAYPSDVTPVVFRQRMIIWTQGEMFLNYLRVQKVSADDAVAGKRTMLMDMLSKRRAR